MTAPITERLRQPSTGLRSTADPSLLVESLLDLGKPRTSPAILNCADSLPRPVAVVDQALEVVEDYHGKILAVEQAVLIKPSMKTVRQCMHLAAPIRARC